MVPLLLPPMIKACPLYESYLLPDYLFWQPISYVTVSLTLFWFFTCMIDHTSQHMTDCFLLVLLIFWSEELPQLPILPEGLGIENHSNDIFASTTNDKAMPARGVISTTIWSLLTSHIICNSKFNLVFIFYLYDRAHQSTYDWLLCYSAYFILVWRASLLHNRSEERRVE